jgi:hypothetical protein
LGLSASATGLADNQRWFEYDLLICQGIALDTVDQHIRNHPANFVDGLVDSCQRGVGMFCHWGIVKPGDGDVFPNG